MLVTYHACMSRRCSSGVVKKGGDCLFDPICYVF